MLSRVRWATNVADVARRQQADIRQLLEANGCVRQEFDAFLTFLRSHLDPSMTPAQAVELLSQHLITRPIFDALFGGHEFSTGNPVARVLAHAGDVLEQAGGGIATSELDGFYEWVRGTIAGITDPADRQAVIKQLYQDFFALAFSSTSERDGIVYTPKEIVDFILRSADRVLRDEFGQSLGDPGVDIIDPFTGTGTFVVNLLRSGLLDAEAVKRKCRRREIRANEISALAYCVAAANIEASYLDVVGGEYTPFPGLVLTDTFRSSAREAGSQSGPKTTVILGNPPYSSGQGAATDDNRNPKYAALDERIESTYAALSTAQLKRSLYDSYLRALRWATDRIGARGVVAFVTNGGYIDSGSAAGVRNWLIAEYSSLYIYNLRGNQRTSGEQSRREGGKIFDSGSRATVAIAVLVKNPEAAEHGVLHYRDIGDYLSREQKLAIIRGGDVGTVEWSTLHPDAHGDWINQRDGSFGGFRGLEAECGEISFFAESSNGVATNRDAWAYSSGATALASNMSRTIAAYTALHDAGATQGRESTADRNEIKWSAGLRADLQHGRGVTFSRAAIRESSYRPFNKQFVYLDPVFNERQGKLAQLYPEADVRNPTIVVTGKSSHYAFAALAVDGVHDLHTLDTGKAFPRYTYRKSRGSFERVDNITDEILGEYRRLYGAEVTKDAIFDFVYGLLHSPEYRERYASDLKKMLPRIPALAAAQDFWAFSRAGAELAALHIGYESATPHPLLVSRRSPVSGPLGAHELRVEKMRYAGKLGAWDKSTVIYNEHLTVSGVPPQVQEYVLGSRSALDWVIERYRVRADGASGIRNDPNDWGAEHGDPAYILTLLKRIVTVSLETVRVVGSLPSLRRCQGSPASSASQR